MKIKVSTVFESDTVPEFKGLSLKEIEKIICDGKPENAVVLIEEVKE